MLLNQSPIPYKNSIKRFSSVALFVFIICLIIALSGCLFPSRPAPEVLAPPEALPDTTPPKSDLFASERVNVPRNALWLTTALNASYQGVPATLALQQISNQHPVRFMFEVKEDFLVAAPIGAITIQDHLDAICNQADWVYTVTPVGVILINDIETKTYFLTSQPGQTTAVIPLRNLGNAANVSTENALNVTLDPYANEILALLETALGLNPGRAAPAPTADPNAAPIAPPETPLAIDDPRTSITVLPSANAVVVTAKPHLMRQADKAIANYIAATSKSVILRITFFEVDVSKTSERSLDLNLLQAAANSFGIRVLPTTPTNNPSSLSVNLLNGSTKGSSLVFRWLNTVGNTSILFEDSVEVRNNTVGSLDATRNRQYIRSITRDTQIQGATTSQAPQVEVDNLFTGWSIHIQPTIAGDEVTVRLALSRSDYVAQVPYSFDQGRIAGVNFVTDDYHRVMAVRLRNGETKLLTSLNNQESRDTTGKTPWLPWIGDKKNQLKRNRETIMMLSAVIL